MLKEERFEYILNGLKADNKVLFEDLSKALNVSEDTIRRDIEILHKSGLLVKVRGGAINPNKNPLSFSDRVELYSESKSIIALKTQQLLQGVNTVFMDGGTTMVEVAARIPIDARFRIITNNIALIPALSTHKGIEIIVLGGRYNRLTQTNIGTQTCAEIRKYQADLYLLGTCAIHSKIGITSSIEEEGEVKTAFMESAFKTAVLSTHEKLETVDFYRVAPITKIETLITDLLSNDPKLDIYRGFGLEML